jgi:hypothetical protein
MQPECPSMVPCDKLSPRPAPQHSKSLTAPPDCTNCSRQLSNPMNNYLSKWKYRDDSVKTANTKRTRPRKLPQTTYHFPLSHTSVNTSNPNFKQNDNNEVTTPPQSQDTSPSESPRDSTSTSSSSRDSSPRDPSTSPRSNYPAMSKNSPISSPRSSPRLLSRDFKHRVQLNKYGNEGEGQGMFADEHQYNRHQIPLLNVHETTRYDNTYDYNMTSPKKHRSNSFVPPPPHDLICNNAMCDSPSSPQSSDNDDTYSSDHSSPRRPNNWEGDSRKRRSSRSSDREPIVLSDSDSEHMMCPSPRPYELSYRSPRQHHPNEQLHDHHSHGDPLGVHHHPLLLSTSHNDLAKYHLEVSRAQNDKSHSLPPLNFNRLPSIGELSLYCPTEDTSPRVYSEREPVRTHHRSQSFPHYNTVR